VNPKTVPFWELVNGPAQPFSWHPDYEGENPDCLRLGLYRGLFAVSPSRCWTFLTPLGSGATYPGTVYSMQYGDLAGLLCSLLVMEVGGYDAACARVVQRRGLLGRKLEPIVPNSFEHVLYASSTSEIPLFVFAGNHQLDQSKVNQRWRFVEENYCKEDEYKFVRNNCAPGAFLWLIERVWDHLSEFQQSAARAYRSSFELAQRLEPRLRQMENDIQNAQGMAGSAYYRN
jgi:hypothetical protein